MNVDVAGRLRTLRREHGLSQGELAEKLDIPRQTVSKWERAEASPDADNLLRLARLYNRSVDDLLAGMDDEESEFVILPEADDGPGLGWFTVYEDENGNPIRPKRPARKQREHRARPAFTQAIPYPMLMCTLYCVLGVLFHLWHPAWLLLMTIPLYEPMRRVRNAPDKAAALHAFPYPLFITFMYLCAGILFGWWHPGWVLFLTIPLYKSAIRQLT